MSGLMKGKRGLIMGLANDRSLAWGIAKALHAHGAEMAFSYQGEALERRVRPLAEEVGSDFLIDCDVSDMAALDSAFERLAARWPTIDFLVHAIGFSDKNELRGKFVDTSLENFLMTMNISAYSLVAVTRRAADIRSVHGPVPMQPEPLQPAKREPAAGRACRVTVSPPPRVVEQVAPQLTPAGVDVTTPLPEPIFATWSE